MSLTKLTKSIHQAFIRRCRCVGLSWDMIKRMTSDLPLFGPIYNWHRMKDDHRPVVNFYATYDTSVIHVGEVGNGRSCETCIWHRRVYMSLCVHALTTLSLRHQFVFTKDITREHAYSCPSRFYILVTEVAARRRQLRNWSPFSTARYWQPPCSASCDRIPTHGGRTIARILYFLSLFSVHSCLKVTLLFW
jgi:hypothetical protein